MFSAGPRGRTGLLVPGLSVLLFLLFTSAFAPEVSAQEIRRTVFSGGAVATVTGAYRVRATIGEAGLVGRSTLSAYTVGQGFWAGHYRLVTTGAPGPDPANTLPSYADELRQNSPNPFRRTTSIAYSVGQPASVTLAVFDVSGRRVATLASRTHDAGLYRVDWEGHDGSGNRVASGVYFYRLEIGSWSSTRKLLNLR